MRLDRYGRLGIFTDTPKRALDVRGDITGYLPMCYRFGGCYFTSGAGRFVDFSGDLIEEATTDNVRNRLIMPFDGYVRKVVINTESEMNTVTLQLYKVAYGSGATVMGNVDGATFGAAKSTTLNDDDDTALVDFDTQVLPNTHDSSSQSWGFSAGDGIALMVTGSQSQSSSGYACQLQGQLVVMFNTVP